MFGSYFRTPVILVLNLLPPVLLLFLFYFLCGKAWIAYTASGLITFVLSGINFYKLVLRDDPFVASDIGLAAEATEILAEYTIVPDWKIILALAAFLLGIVFTSIFLRPRLKNKWIRVFGTGVVCGVFILLCGTVYSSDRVYQAVDNSADINIWSEAQVYTSKGFVYPFLHSFFEKDDQKPDAYNAAEAEKLFAAFETKAIPEDKKVHVISIMLEAYADFTKFDSLKLKEDVYGKLELLREESIYGNIIDNIFAGGTIDTERSFLTGYVTQGDYAQETNSYVYYMRDQGYYTEGFHAGDGWYYDRIRVNENIGFENYFFLEDCGSSDRTDAFFFPMVRSLYDNRDPDRPYFSYNLSYQNHGAYYSDWTVDTQYVQPGIYTEASYNILNNYMSGIYDTTERLYDFIQSFKYEEEPVVIVVFGDHMPWLGNGNSVYEELRINLDLSTEEGFYNYYSTPYLIWANGAAKEMLDNDFSGYGGDFSSCFLMNKVFELCSWEGNSFMQASDMLKTYTDVVHISGVFREDGKLTTELSDEAETYWHAFENMEYYWENTFYYNIPK